MAYIPCVKEKGKSNATRPYEITRLFNFLKIKKNNVFCDLGCGDGALCIKSISRVRKAIGIECDEKRYLTAKNKTEKNDNIRIYKGIYTHKKSINRIKDATVFYCVNGECVDFLQNLDKSVKKGTLYIQYGLPPCPIMPEFKLGWYYIMKTPFKMANSENEWIRSLKRGNFVNLKRNVRKRFKKIGVEELEEDLKKNFP